MGTLNENKAIYFEYSKQKILETGRPKNVKYFHELMNEWINIIAKFKFILICFMIVRNLEATMNKRD